MTQKKFFILKTDNGDVTYPIPDLDFSNLVCDLEEYGINVYNLTQNDSTQYFSTLRAIMAIIIKADSLASAGKALTVHLKNGGETDAILEVFTEAMKQAGFGTTAEETETEAEETNDQTTKETAKEKK